MEEMFNVYNNKNKNCSSLIVVNQNDNVYNNSNINNNINNNINDNNNNNNNNKLGKLFLKVWKNKIIRKEIIRFIRFLNQKYYMKKEFKKLKLFRESKDKYYLNSIIIDGTFDDDESLLTFLKKLPANVDTLELRNIGKLLEMKDLVLPLTLKSLILNNTILKSFNESSNFLNRLLIKKSPNISPLSGLTCFDLGFNNEKVLLDQNLPPTLQRLIIRHQITRPITKGMLPEQLQSLEIHSEYHYPVIYLPKTLKQFKVSLQNTSNSFLDPIILDFIPSGITELLLYRGFKSPSIKPFNVEAVSNLKKLVFSYNNNNNYVDNNNSSSIIYNNGNNSSINQIPYSLPKDYLNNIVCNLSNTFTSKLTSLDLSNNKSCKQFNTGFLPESIVKLRLPLDIVLEHSSKSGFPSSLTSLEGSSIHLFSKFKNSLNIKYLKITYFKDNNNNGDSINSNDSDNAFNSNGNNNSSIELFKKFPNLKSLRFLYFEKHLNSFLKLVNSSSPDCFVNLELNSIFKHHNFKDENSWPLLQCNLRTLKLDENYTMFLMKKAIESTPLSSPFPASVQLLDLNFRASPLFDSPPIRKEILPPDIKVLIIRGIYKPAVLELPKSLEMIWIQHNNSVLRDSYFMKKYSNLIRVFNSNDSSTHRSKIYKNLKNQILDE
ncbi:hypothetical protein DICPUDRAFT_150561 [Dictyostelium purpureum]|uniref:FNIP repeat-containing protein n=1 Tax=Dictyostelium purpureum TaxID=5786 RepID=F0ZGM8_DICPU|nr:uncharacterized protein DICPUDRAFT_150561 [Dictyostelium purpureum]EGC36933.1 hypothetical protein DICPUDRAFT_150561 [Dictyostelium purpureum]|eukprot:XP_003286576.1 hypothetical protein DICPUDRAFT_150561 [Dictyostelium purpureum]